MQLDSKPGSYYLCALPPLLGVTSVSVKVGFELRAATGALALLAAVGSGYGRRTAALLAAAGRLSRGFGSSGGAVVAELWWADGSTSRRWASLSGDHDGQTMAALPAVLAARALVGGCGKAGSMAVYELIAPEALLTEVAARGFSVYRSEP